MQLASLQTLKVGHGMPLMCCVVCQRSLIPSMRICAETIDHQQVISSARSSALSPRGYVADAHAAFVASKVSQYLSEELGEGAAPTKNDSSAKANIDAAAARRRALLAAMTQHGASTLGLHIQAASHYLQQSARESSEQRSADAAASNAAVGAALDGMVAMVAWLPMRAMRGSALLDACATLAQNKDFRGHVVELLMQVRCTKTCRTPLSHLHL